MISVYESIDKCSGCGACADACGHKAILMDVDKYGFRYPVIDQKKCIDCGLCLKTCNYKPILDKSNIKVFVAQRKSSEIYKSASGGIFAELAESVISQGGVVYGCSYVRDSGGLHPVISEATSLAELIPMFGSKYVQSSANDIYRKVKRRLLDGYFVLFSGLPCQVAGLNGFLRKEYKNLLTIDVICHGTPNEFFFQSFIDDLEKKIKGVITKFNFRGKQKGWGNYIYSYSYIDVNGKEVNSWGYFEDQVYCQLFLSSSIYRESCYHCPFASINRPSDITIGDCWGIEKEHPEYDNKNGGNFDFKKGLSCIIVNTQKGHDMINNHSKGFQLASVSLESVMKYNHQLYKPSNDSPYRKVYYDTFLEGGYHGLVKKYYQLEWLRIFKSRLYDIYIKSRDFLKG